MGCSNFDEIVLGAFIKFWVPNAFTPNNDGINDVFQPKALFPNYGSYRLLIFNRSGQLIFESKKLSDGWDGTFNNKDCPAGVYVWQLSCSGDGVVTYGEENKKQGTVTLLR
jgi:gliding motility-associated-like protein